MFSVFHSPNGDRPCVVISQYDYTNEKGESTPVADIVVFCKFGEGRNFYDSTFYLSGVQVSSQASYGTVTVV